ncbi:MAG: Rho termination factor N-terminal domain-containing protein [Candidatus Helarchaeota archaeon]
MERKIKRINNNWIEKNSNGRRIALVGWKEKLNELTITGLKKICKQLGIKGYSKRKKGALINSIYSSIETRPDIQDLITSEYQKRIDKKKPKKKTSLSKIEKILPASQANDSIVIQLLETVNKLISYTKNQFNTIDLELQKLNKRLVAIESLSNTGYKLQREKIRLDPKKLLEIIEILTKQKKGGYLSFYQLRKYLNEYYIVENTDWGKFLEVLRSKGKIEFSKGAKITETDKGYRDSFNRIYYYFRLRG